MTSNPFLKANTLYTFPLDSIHPLFLWFYSIPNRPDV